MAGRLTLLHHTQPTAQSKNSRAKYAISENASQARNWAEYATMWDWNAHTPHPRRSTRVFFETMHTAGPGEKSRSSTTRCLTTIYSYCGMRCFAKWERVGVDVITESGPCIRCDLDPAESCFPLCTSVQTSPCCQFL